MYRTAPGEDNCIVNDPTNISGLIIAKDNNWTPHNQELNGSNRSSRIKLVSLQFWEKFWEYFS
jgi:hypothetical protein